MSKNIIDNMKELDNNSVVNKTYDDVIHPTASFLGVTVCRTIKVAFAPIRSLIWSAEKLEEWVLNKVSGYLEGVPEENIITPDPLIAVPLLEQVRISDKHEHLKELYAKLLAKAMNKMEADKILPSYVDVIKQLSVLDVEILELLRKAHKNRLPLVDIRLKYDSGYNPIFNNLTLLKINTPKNISIALDNLSRLKLIDIPWDSHILPMTIYDKFKNTVQFKQGEAYVNITPNVKSVELKKKQFLLTDFALEFITICK